MYGERDLLYDFGVDRTVRVVFVLIFRTDDNSAVTWQIRR